MIAKLREACNRYRVWASPPHNAERYSFLTLNGARAHRDWLQHMEIYAPDEDVRQWVIFDSKEGRYVG